MANTVGRFIKNNISSIWAPLEALGSGLDQLFLISNTNHLADESNYRTLCSVPGFCVGGIEITRTSPTGANPPTLPSDFEWWSPQQYTPLVGDNPVAAMSLGTHVVHRIAREQSRWPDLVLRCRIDPPETSADKVYGCLLVQPGSVVGPSSAPSATPGGSFWVGEVAGGMGWGDMVIRCTIQDRDISSRTDSPLLGAPTFGASSNGELVVTNQISAWVSFFKTSSSGKSCQAVGLTLSLEPKP